MSEEKWNRFAATGSVRDYLEYRAGGPHGAEKPESSSRTAGEEQAHGADDSAEWNGTLCNAHRGL